MKWLGTLLCLGMTYPSSLSDTEWDHLQCYLPPIQTRGRPHSHSLRAILDAIFYLLRTACPWRYLPRDFPPWQTVYYHIRRFRLSGMWHLILTSLRTAEQQRVGRDTQPTAAIIDAQSVKTIEESALISGYDGHKNVKGRKTASAGGHPGSSALGLRHAGRCPRPRRSKVPARWAQTACDPFEEDLGRWSLQW
jgi:transposase